MRAKLLSGINKWLNKSGLTQTEAAEQLGVTQARVSEIKNGKINRFSLSMLVRLAQRAGLRPGSSYSRQRDGRDRLRRTSAGISIADGAQRMASASGPCIIVDKSSTWRRFYMDDAWFDLKGAFVAGEELRQPKSPTKRAQELHETGLA